MTKTLLKVENLKTWFDTEQGTIRAVDGVDFRIGPGKTFALLGESGCGKSITALSLLQLVPAPAASDPGERGDKWLDDNRADTGYVAGHVRLD